MVVHDDDGDDDADDADDGDGDVVATSPNESTGQELSRNIYKKILAPIMKKLEPFEFRHQERHLR